MALGPLASAIAAATSRVLARPTAGSKQSSEDGHATRLSTIEEVRDPRMDQQWTPQNERQQAFKFEWHDPVARQLPFTSELEESPTPRGPAKAFGTPTFGDAVANTKLGAPEDVLPPDAAPVAATRKRPRPTELQAARLATATSSDGVSPAAPGLVPAVDVPCASESPSQEPPAKRRRYTSLQTSPAWRACRRELFRARVAPKLCIDLFPKASTSASVVSSTEAPASVPTGATSDTAASVAFTFGTASAPVAPATATEAAKTGIAGTNSTATAATASAPASDSAGAKQTLFSFGPSSSSATTGASASGFIFGAAAPAAASAAAPTAATAPAGSAAPAAPIFGAPSAAGTTPAGPAAPAAPIFGAPSAAGTAPFGGVAAPSGEPSMFAKAFQPSKPGRRRPRR